MTLFLAIAPVLSAGILCLLTDMHALRLWRIHKRQKENRETGGILPPATILISVHDEEDRLRRNLPLFLQQEYGEEYEVIVVDIHSHDGTMDYLTDMETFYPNLRHTSIPESARDVSMNRLALSLGFKSASFEWVILTHADCRPCDSKWLSRMMNSCTSGYSSVAGLTRYLPSEEYSTGRQMFHHLWNQMLWMPYAQKHARYWAEGNNLCYRRSKFFSHHGFASHANLVAGAETLLANHHIGKGEGAVNADSGAMLLQETPDMRIWRREQLFERETMRYAHHGFLYRGWHLFNVAWPLCYTLLSVAMVALYYPDLWIVGISVLLWLVHSVVYDCCYNRTARALGYKAIHWSLPYYTLCMPLWEVRIWWAHRQSDKRIFQKKHF